MGLETVLDRIRDNGKAEAAAVVADGRRERERLLAETRAEGEKLRQRREVEAADQVARRRVQDLARAELDAKKLVLAAQEGVLHEVRDRVKVRLAAMPSTDALRRMLAKNAAEWRSGRVFCAKKDEAATRGIVGGNFGGTIETIGGVVIESTDGTRRLDLTYDSILEDLWDDVIKEVARTLWPPK